MNYDLWLKQGGAITFRAADPYAKKIIVPVTIFVRDRLSLDGQARKIDTNALIDTGATITAIDTEVAKSLKLIPVSRCTVSGVHGPKDVDMFSFSINIGGSLPIRVRIVS